MIYTHVAKGPAPQCESPLDLLPILSNTTSKTNSETTLIIPTPQENKSNLELIEPEAYISINRIDTEVEALDATPKLNKVRQFKYLYKALELVKKLLH